MRVYIGKKKYQTHKPLFSTLKSIYGFGTTHLNYCFRRLGVRFSKRIADLDYGKIRGISTCVSDLSTLSDLRRFQYKLLKLHRNVGTYKGLRMRQGLPRNGQRTHSNASTARRLFAKTKGFF